MNLILEILEFISMTMLIAIGVFVASVLYAASKDIERQNRDNPLTK